MSDFPVTCYTVDIFYLLSCLVFTRFYIRVPTPVALFRIGRDEYIYLLNKIFILKTEQTKKKQWPKFVLRVIEYQPLP